MLQAGPDSAFAPPDTIPTRSNLFGVLIITGPPLSPGQALEVEDTRYAEFATSVLLKAKAIVVVIGS